MPAPYGLFCFSLRCISLGVRPDFPKGGIPSPRARRPFHPNRPKWGRLSGVRYLRLRSLEGLNTPCTPHLPMSRGGNPDDGRSCRYYFFRPPPAKPPPTPILRKALGERPRSLPNQSSPIRAQRVKLNWVAAQLGKRRPPALTR